MYFALLQLCFAIKAVLFLYSSNFLHWSTESQLKFNTIFLKVFFNISLSNIHTQGGGGYFVAANKQYFLPNTNTMKLRQIFSFFSYWCLNPYGSCSINTHYILLPHWVQWHSKLPRIHLQQTAAPSSGNTPFLPPSQFVGCLKLYIFCL